jgi:dolichol kinase
LPHLKLDQVNSLKRLIVEPRKIVHLSGAVFAFTALYSPYLSIAGICAGLILFLCLEKLKPFINPALLTVVYRDGEIKKSALEPLMYLVSILFLLIISLYIAPEVCYASIIVLAVGDGAASVIGKLFGRHRLPLSDKTWEGSISGFLLSVIAGYLFIGPLILVGSFFGMLTEAYAGKHENVFIAASAFISMLIATSIL